MRILRHQWLPRVVLKTYFYTLFTFHNLFLNSSYTIGCYVVFYLSSKNENRFRLKLTLHARTFAVYAVPVEDMLGSGLLQKLLHVWEFFSETYEFRVTFSLLILPSVNWHPRNQNSRPTNHFIFFLGLKHIQPQNQKYSPISNKRAIQKWNGRLRIHPPIQSNNPPHCYLINQTFRKEEVGWECTFPHPIQQFGHRFTLLPKTVQNDYPICCDPGDDFTIPHSRCTSFTQSHLT